MKNRIDHIAIGASTLAQGVAMMQASLGVSIPAGGKHRQMSTHNCLAQLGQQRYIELIAIDPDAPDPGRQRWFSLDDPATRARLAERPRALCWVVGTTDLDSLVQDSPVDLGEILNLSRGDLSWRLTVPRDGSLPEAGLLPAFIEWPTSVHPSTAMPDPGITLRSIELGHPDPDALRRLLQALGVSQLASVCHKEVRTLSFTLKTAEGKLVSID